MNRLKMYWKFTLVLFLTYFIHLHCFSQCKQDYSWAAWSNFKGREATGTIQVNGRPVNVTMSANYEFGSTDKIFDFVNFGGYSGVAAIPNTTVPKTEWAVGAGGQTTMCFSEPVTNPLLLISSLGSFFSPGSSNNSSVTLRFSEPFVIDYKGSGIKNVSSYSITGEEGYAILLFPGTFTCLTIFSDTPEYYTNITWGLQPPIFPVKITEDSKSCGSTVLTASGGISYRWSGGKTPTNATNTFEESGVYSVTATDANKCTSIALKVVNVPPKVQDATTNKTICQGETYEGYSSSGTYKDTFKTALGCDSTRTLNLSVIGLPQVTFNAANEFCEGNIVELSPTITPNNLPVSYKWTTGETTPKINVAKTGTYAITVSNGACSKSFSTTVVVGKPPELKPNETLCFSSPSMVLDAGALGTNTYSYFWASSNTTNPQLTIFQPGTYAVKVSTLGGGCVTSRTITVLPTPQVDLGLDKITCEGEAITLRPNVNASGGNINYSWSNGGTGIETKVSQSGQYILTATQGPCSGRDTIIVRNHPSPNVASEATTCNEKPLFASENDDSDLAYLWDSGETTRSIQAQPDGIYRVKVTNQFGCILTRTITVSGPCNPRFYVPDIFTPNGDGVNDTFKAIMVGGEIVSLTVYNRWGHPVYFEQSNNPQWNGTFKDAAAPNGSYVYLLQYKIQNSESITEFRGAILLER
ncbi:T9SS C-terminal target domain-containing protein [Runella limosa]|uniref:T9SS C-terminal target domain-containing protein n=1 Tax=Runella limosa TaxID=370978 RepID=UPI00048D8A52|nr:T9SS C-terminal target domain-containing protein [Runella limosa]